jgi:hypothetical protein
MIWIFKGVASIEATEAIVSVKKMDKHDILRYN